MSVAEAQKLVAEVLTIHRTHPHAPALDVLNLVMKGRRQLPEFGDIALPPAPFALVNDAVKAGKTLIADTDKKIDELKRQTRNATAEAKAANEKNMAELQVQKKAAQAELAKLEKASGEIWDATKTGFSNAARELGPAYDKAVASARK